MTFSEIMGIWWPSQAGVSAAIWLVIIIIMMWLARIPAHRAIRSFSFIIRNAMRMTAHSITSLEKHLKERNREVLLATGMEETERYIEREFQRVEDVVTRDLSGYPSLQRELKDQITKIDNDMAAFLKDKVLKEQNKLYTQYRIRLFLFSIWWGKWIKT